MLQATLAFAETPAVAGADTQSKPSATIEAVAPSAPRPQQIEAMVEPIKRVAPRAPEGKVKVEPSPPKSAKTGCSSALKSNKSKDACAVTTKDRIAASGRAKPASKTLSNVVSTAAAKKKR